MKIKSQGLFKNLGLKIFSLLVAMGIWFFVVIANKPELNFVVPLNFKNIPEDMQLVGGENYELEIRVKGDQIALGSLSSRQIDATLDLEYASPGETVYEIAPWHITLPPGLQVTRIVPQKVKFKLEPLMERMVPVEAVILGVPAEGYELKEVAVFPKTLRVVGAQSKVEELESVRTTSLNITGFDASVSKKLKLLPLPDKLELSDGSSVEVRAIIVEKSEEHSWVVPVQITPVRWHAVIEPLEVKVTGIGPISKIRPTKTAEIKAVIDLLELKPEQVQLEVKIQLPENILLVSQDPLKVKVISIEKPSADEMLRPTIGGGLPPLVSPASDINKK